MIKPKVLKGFRDSLPEDEIVKRFLIKTLTENFESFGFVPIDTPALELTEVLLGKGGGETDKQMYRFEDNGGRDVSMRFDLTVPFARFMAKNVNDLYLPFKRYHIAKVWRGENTQKGRYREFHQCDFDIVGSDTASADFEILLMIKRSLKALGVKSTTININHRGIFNTLLSSLGLEGKTADILRLVDKLPKIGSIKVLEALSEIAGSEKSDTILKFIEKKDSFRETIDNMKELSGGDSEYTERLEEIWKMAEEVGIQDNVVLNPAITRGLDYYTGLVYETFLNDLPEIGSVCSGGRYNNLAGLYTKQEMPGVGASVGLDRLLAGLDELNALERRKSLTDVLIFQMDSELTGHYHKIAELLREQSISCEVYPVNKKLQAQFKFAEKKGIPLGILCGKDEKSGDVVNLKNLVTRENFDSITLQDAINKIKTKKI